MLQNPQGETIQGMGYVDLGLPSGTLWATCNLDASKETEHGIELTWKEALKAAIPGGGHLPSTNEISELIKNTACEWTSRYNGKWGNCGIICTSKTNGNKIFLPAQHYGGYYWSSDIFEDKGYRSYSEPSVSYDNMSWVLNVNEYLGLFITPDVRESHLYVRGVK